MLQNSTACAAIGAVYPSESRGLTADLRAGAELDLRVYPVCASIVMAGHGVVTDITEVPEDTVRAQLEHLAATVAPAAMKIGVLGSHGAARAVLDAAEGLEGPVVMDLQVSGPSGETVLTQRGLDTVMDRLEIPDVVTLSYTDAELVSGGEIRSLDDAQVAAQRIVRRGARAVLVKGGTLPARHFEAEGVEAGDGVPVRFASDLFYDGSEFALFEAPYLQGSGMTGASSFFALSLLKGLVSEVAITEAMQMAKAFVTESLRRALPASRD